MPVDENLREDAPRGGRADDRPVGSGADPSAVSGRAGEPAGSGADFPAGGAEPGEGNLAGQSARGSAGQPEEEPAGQPEDKSAGQPEDKSAVNPGGGGAGDKSPGEGKPSRKGRGQRRGDGEPEKAKAETEKLKAELESLRSELADTKDKLLRTAAEFDNYRKRTEREKAATAEYARASAAKPLLPILDNIERSSASEAGSPEYIKGIEMIVKQFRELAGNLGLEPIGEPGEEFDPAVHEAVMHVEDESLGENTVAEVLQKGYRLGDTVLRAAMVKVAN